MEKKRKRADSAPSRGAPPSGSRKKATKQRTNLTLDPDVVAIAERYAKRYDKSISQLVNDFLRSLVGREPGEDAERLAGSLTPPVRRLYGLAAGSTVDRGAYRAHLSQKYGSR